MVELPDVEQIKIVLRAIRQSGWVVAEFGEGWPDEPNVCEVTDDEVVREVLRSLA